jgi:tripartite ATP-independent transporter DctP family solute receptor
MVDNVIGERRNPDIALRRGAVWSRRAVTAGITLGLVEALTQLSDPIPANAAEVTVKVATSASGIISKMSKLMGVEVKKRVAGRVDWKLFGGGQLGTEGEIMMGLMQGTHMVAMNGGWFQNILPEFAIFDTPFLFNHRDEAKGVATAIQDDLAKAVLHKGIVLIGIGALGFRNITNNVRPIMTPADLRGIKIRTPGNPFSIETFKALGANPTPMEAGELYMALRGGVVDGQENPLASIWSLKYYEVQKYISISRHIFSPVFIGVSARYWNRWPLSIQTAIREAAQVASDFSFQEDARSERVLRGRIQLQNPSIQFNEVDTAAFKTAMAPLIAARQARFNPLIWNKAMTALQSHRALASLG